MLPATSSRLCTRTMVCLLYIPKVPLSKPCRVLRPMIDGLPYLLQPGKGYAWRHDVFSCWIQLSCQPYEACPVGFTKASTFPGYPGTSLCMMHARRRRYTLYNVLIMLEISIYCVEYSRKSTHNLSLLGLVSESSATLTSSLSKGMHLETDGSCSKVCPTCF